MGKIKLNGIDYGGGSGSGDTVEWTQIEQSGTKIAEIDINGTSQNVYAPSGGGDNYTTTEKVVGTWIDGKPLYQKTFKFKSSATSGAAADVSIGASVDYAQMLCGVVDNGYGNFLPLNLLTNDASNAGNFGIRNYAHASKPNTVSFTATLASWLDKWVIATVQYTKTTD